LILDDSGTICYDGIDSTFDQTQEGFIMHKNLYALIGQKPSDLNGRETLELIGQKT